MKENEKQQYENFWQTVRDNPPGYMDTPSGNRMKMSTELQAIVFNEKGEEQYRIVEYDRKVTNSFCSALALAMTTSTEYSLSAFKYHYSGSGTDAENASDTGLLAGTSASGHVLGTQATATDTCSGRPFTSVATITYTTTSTGLVVSEHLICNTTSATDAKFICADRTQHAGLTVQSGWSIAYTYKISYVAGG